VAPADCLAAYQPVGAASYAASLTDLSGTGNNATEGTPPDWNATDGWIFNGATNSRYLFTGIVPAAGYSMIVRYSNYDQATSGHLAGYDDSSGGRFRIMLLATSRRYFYGDSFKTKSAATPAAGVMCQAGAGGYFNSVLDYETVGAFTGTSAEDIVIGTYQTNDGTIISSYFVGYIKALAIYSTTLSAIQVSAITDAMNLL
jgi:hypothetical protein